MTKSGSLKLNINIGPIFNEEKHFWFYYNPKKLLFLQLLSKPLSFSNFGLQRQFLLRSSLNENHFSISRRPVSFP